MARHDISTWVMIICDANLDQILRTYSGFTVVRLSNKKEWKNEIARFYEGDPVADYEDARAYAESISNVVLEAANISDFWKIFGSKPKLKKYS